VSERLQLLRPVDGQNAERLSSPIGVGHGQYIEESATAV
jgi:hypothetical protein